MEIDIYTYTKTKGLMPEQVNKLDFLLRGRSFYSGGLIEGRYFNGCMFSTSHYSSLNTYLFAGSHYFFDGQIFIIKTSQDRQIDLLISSESNIDKYVIGSKKLYKYKNMFEGSNKISCFYNVETDLSLIDKRRFIDYMYSFPNTVSIRYINDEVYIACPYYYLTGDFFTNVDDLNKDDEEYKNLNRVLSRILEVATYIDMEA